MEFIIELVFDLLLEGSIEVSSNKKISKWIRYPILALLILFFTVVIFGMIILGFVLLSKSLLGGILIMIIGLVLLIMCIYKFRKKYLEIIDK